MLVALALTMALAPRLIQQSATLADLVGVAAARNEDDPIARDSRNLDDHVILCGCGRVGRLMACVLEAATIPYLEADLTHLRQLGPASSCESRRFPGVEGG